MLLEELRNSSILIAGGTGFVGTWLNKALLEIGCDDITSIGRNDGDLCDYVDTELLISGYQPDYIFNLSGWNGNISFNNRNPFDIFYRNTVMNLNLLRACVVRVKKIVSMVASCAYGNHNSWHKMNNRAEGVCFEPDFLEGKPHHTVDCHGYAKRNVQLASRMVHSQYNLTAVTACPPTLFGPKDSFNPNRTKVVGGLIGRFCDAIRREESSVTVWGSGKPLRELCYVEDCAKLLIDTMLYYDDSEMPLNLGTGQEVSIKQLAEMIAKLTSFKGNIIYDTSKPDGQIRKYLDRSRMREILPSRSFTTLEDGLKVTIDYYKETCQ